VRKLIFKFEGAAVAAVQPLSFTCLETPAAAKLHTASAIALLCHQPLYTEKRNARTELAVKRAATTTDSLCHVGSWEGCGGSIRLRWTRKLQLKLSQLRCTITLDMLWLE
jgi:hypothetical protein